MADIFDEIDEELRTDRIRSLVKSNVGIIVAAGLAILIAVGGWQATRWWQAKRNLVAAGSYLVAQSEADRITPGATTAFEKLSATAPAGYATLALLRGAALNAIAGDPTGASMLWERVANDTSADLLLRDLSQLLEIEHHLGSDDPANLEARLKSLSMTGNPWRDLALEARGLLAMRTGQIDLARETFRALSRDSLASEDARRRAGVLLNRLEG